MKKLFSVLLVGILALSLFGCTAQSQHTFFAMNTFMDLQTWGADAEDALVQIRQELTRLEKRWSVTGDNSALALLNQGLNAQLSAEEEAFLQRVEALSLRTNGAFDPKLHSVSLAWGFYNEGYRVPSDTEIQAALADPKWDLGAALKGYAGDRAVEILKQHKVERAILNLGGNIQTYGQKPDGSPWQIGIQNPNGGNYLGVVSVSGTASIVTSGDYQRYFEKDGVRYHHIIDPKTGCPADSGLRAVTVICRDGLTADALSTALYVMGLENATEFWRQSEDFEAVFITNEGKVYATQGAGLSGCEFEVIKR